MSFWEVDFYRRPLEDEFGNSLWELLVCDPASSLCHSAFCSQPQVSSDWLAAHLQELLNGGHAPPDEIRVFRPQTFNLLETACKTLGIRVEPDRGTPTLKRWLTERAKDYSALPNYTRQSYAPLHPDKPPPLPLPENLWGEQWRFATLPAGEVVEAFADRPIPILHMPEALLPIKLGLASTAPISGVVINGGRKSMQLARWIQQSRPVSLNYIAGAPDGLILEAGLVDRWIVATFDDVEVKIAAKTYEQHKQQSKGLHFLLV